LATPAMPPAKLGSEKADRSSVDRSTKDALADYRVDICASRSPVSLPFLGVSETSGSNPLSSSGESGANLSIAGFSAIRAQPFLHRRTQGSNPSPSKLASLAVRNPGWQ